MQCPAFSRHFQLTTPLSLGYSKLGYIGPVIGKLPWHRRMVFLVILPLLIHLIFPSALYYLLNMQGKSSALAYPVCITL